MPTYGLVVEGPYDEVALKELIQKCAPTPIEVISRPCGPKGHLMKRFPGFLEEFRYRSDVDKALVIRDCDSYTGEVARKIAANANVDTIGSRCPSFKQFREAVLDC